jgi:hypothetical protein
MLVGEVWDGSRLSAWTNQSAPDDSYGPRAREVTIDGKTWIELGCFSSDVAPLTPNQNPRAQLVGPAVINQGEEYHLDVTVQMPASALPKSWTNDGAHWVEVLQPFYGPPYAGSPPLRLISMDGAKLSVREADLSPRWSTDALAAQWRGVTWTFGFTWWHKTAAQGGGYGVRAIRDGGSNDIIVPWRSYDCVQSCNNGGANAVYLDAYMGLGTATHLGPVRFCDVKLTRLA